MKPITNKKLCKALRGCADHLDLPYEDRDEDFEEGAAVWAMREASERLEQLEAEKEQLSIYKNLADEYGLSVFADLAELQKQRDVLLAALEWATSCLHFDDDDIPEAAENLRKARAAIASVKGGA